MPKRVAPKIKERMYLGVMPHAVKDETPRGVTKPIRPGDYLVSAITPEQAFLRHLARTNWSLADVLCDYINRYLAQNFKGSNIVWIPVILLQQAAQVTMISTRTLEEVQERFSTYWIIRKRNYSPGEKGKKNVLGLTYYFSAKK